MQIIKNIEQGTNEWLSLRLGVATASNFNKIITSKGEESDQLKGYALSLATDIFLINPEEGYKSESMIKGNILEPLARQAYQEETLEFVEQITMFKSDCGNFGYSPDGLVGNNGLLETKNPDSKTHFKYIIENKVPSNYIPQLQGGLWVSEREWIDFVSYGHNFKEKQLLIIRVYRDEKFISELAKLAQKTIEIRDNFVKQFRG